MEIEDKKIKKALELYKKTSAGTVEATEQIKEINFHGKYEELLEIITGLHMQLVGMEAILSILDLLKEEENKT